MSETKRSTRITSGIAAAVICAAVAVAGVWIYQASTAAVAAHDQMVAASSEISLELGASSREDQHVQQAAADAATIHQNQVDAAAAQKAADAKIAAAKAAAAKAAAEKAAVAQAASAATAQHQSSDDTGSGQAAAPVQATKCPAGSSANSGTIVNGVSVDTSCFPDICFHITLPDPNHPECVTAFKP